MRRAICAAAALLSLTMSAGACYGPLPVQYAALTVVLGRPVAVVAVCGRPSVRVEVYLADAMDGALHEWSVTVTPPKPARYVEVELFGAARPGWRIDPQGQTIGSGPASFKVVPLTSIEPGRHYTLDSSDGGPEGARALTVRFTTDDLARIGQGQVLVPDGRDRTSLMSRESFIDARCP